MEALPFRRPLRVGNCELSAQKNLRPKPQWCIPRGGQKRKTKILAQTLRQKGRAGNLRQWKISRIGSGMAGWRIRSGHYVVVTTGSYMGTTHDRFQRTNVERECVNVRITGSGVAHVRVTITVICAWDRESLSAPWPSVCTHIVELALHLTDFETLEMWTWDPMSHLFYKTSYDLVYFRTTCLSKIRALPGPGGSERGMTSHPDHALASNR